MADTTKKPTDPKTHPITKLMETTLAKVRELGDAETIIGKPVVTPDGVTVIPVSKLSCGFGTGGSDFNTRHNSNAVLFGGGGGAGVEITPVSFIVIRGDRVDVLPAGGTVAAPVSPSSIIATVEKAVETVPGLIEKVEAFLADRKAKKAAKAAEEGDGEIAVVGQTAEAETDAQ
ncbi:MAG: sporulation protein YtfJ [Clostridia bacterium]|nr:sporulation protein YtfJ [Oscillospiraceae bacterium]MBQ4048541.1 sporulation protein YtfJ [Clostridia bacterium]MBR7137297.1 sporulation protein YtfJ [Clostridia bacterium]